MERGTTQRNTFKKIAREVANAIGATSAVGLSVIGAAYAQTAPKAPEAAKTIENIIVTTQRRAEDLLSVSVSVSAVTGEKLAERNITDVSQMESLSPGFTFGRSGTDARPAMRGVRTEKIGRASCRERV